MKEKVKVLITILIVCAIAPAAATGEIIYVDDDATGANDGSSWTDAYNDLQDALTDAGSAAKLVEICVAQGIYKPDQSSADSNGSGDRYATFQLISGVTLKGGYAGFGELDPNARDIKLYETILSGDLNGNDIEVDPCDLLTEPTRAENSYHVVTGSGTDANTVVDGFTITSGNANEDFPAGEQQGGGIYFCSGKIINCTISDNSAHFGGGICYGTGKITNCTITRNFAGYRGGGMSYSDLQMTNCTISENSAVEGGGGINNTAGDVMLINCIFIRNSAREGGAIWYIDGNFGVQTLTNCTFSGNSAEMGGGAIYLDYSSPTVTNCILWGNTASSGEQIYNDGTSSPTVTYSDLKGGWPGLGNIDADPCFVDANNGDHHLKSQAGRWEPESESWVLDDITSPCIDAGDPMSPIGPEPFPNGGRINMGAYGGTLEASKSYFGEPVCQTIVAGDINGDCEVNFKDFALMALHWLECIGPNQGRLHLVEDDTEDSYSCEGNFDASFPCSNAVDEDWDTYALPADGGAASCIYENYIIPSGIAMAEFTIKYRQTAAVTPGLCTNVTEYWDGSTWKELNCTALTNQISTLSVRIPYDALSRSTLQLRTRIWKSLDIPGSGSGMYYEGKVIWSLIPVCQNIVAGDVNSD